MASTKALLFTVLVAFALYWGNTFAQNEDSELAPEAMQNAQSSQGQEMRSVQSSSSMANTGNVGNMPSFSMGNTGNMPPFSMGNTGNMPPFSMGNMQLPNQDYQDQAATNQFMPSPYASQYQYSLQDLLGHMISMPWNNGQGQVPFYQNNGDVMPMPSVQMGQTQGLFPGPPVTKALAVLTTPANSSVRGMVVFTQTQQGGGLSITGNITGFRPNSTHGFHIHQVRFEKTRISLNN
jgi:hypothetical protein